MAAAKKHRPASSMPPVQHRDRGSRASNVTRLVVSYVVLIALMALASPISQTALAPVYGFTPSGFYTREAFTVSFIIGAIIEPLVTRIDLSRYLSILAIYTFWIPVLSSFLCSYSQRFGVVAGPTLLGQLSCHSVIMLGALATAAITRQLASLRDISLRFISLVTVVGLPFLLRVEETLTSIFSTFWAFEISQYGPVALQLAMASLFTLLALMHKPSWSWKWFLVLPALIHTIVSNPHLGSRSATDDLTRRLASKDWLLLQRHWSNTGYLSVLENVHLGYRVLRCDHSLLGGEWLVTPARQKNEGWKVTEPIYHVFEMLEAVRLIKLDPPIRDATANALIVGLGIGTAPKAFISHGINTTILELDPVVHDLATKYFNLPSNHTAVLQDAIRWIHDETSKSSPQSFDYILHDVFTGGAEPLSLFTFEFLSRLRMLLSPHGVVALNYAGDLTLPLTRRVLNTIDMAFNGSCRAFRDSVPSKDSEEQNLDADFVNLVVFCRNSRGPIGFRQPRPEDFLQSRSRQQYLLPSPEQEVRFPDRGRSDGEDDVGVLRAGDEKQWKAQQLESAKRHWKIMRTVMPDFVWELW